MAPYMLVKWYMSRTHNRRGLCVVHDEESVSRCKKLPRASSGSQLNMRCGTHHRSRRGTGRPRCVVDTRLPCIYTLYMKTQVNVKIDAEVKKEAQRRAKELGLSLSSVVNVTLKQFARTGRIDLSVPQERMSPYLEQIVKEARAEHAAGKTAGPFSTTEELIASLES